jgi:large subunit ribosomal protein L35
MQNSAHRFRERSADGLVRQAGWRYSAGSLKNGGGANQTESKMPKMKTKSSVKKRFKITASGKVKVAAAGKQHGMIKRSNKFIRDARGTMVLSDADAKIVKKMMPYGR